jgi:hypothetical protein
MPSGRWLGRRGRGTPLRGVKLDEIRRVAGIAFWVAPSPSAQAPAMKFLWMVTIVS